MGIKVKRSAGNPKLCQMEGIGTISRPDWWGSVPSRGFARVLTRSIPVQTRWPLNYSWSGNLSRDGKLTGKWTNAKPVK